MRNKKRILSLSLTIIMLLSAFFQVQTISLAKVEEDDNSGIVVIGLHATSEDAIEIRKGGSDMPDLSVPKHDESQNVMTELSIDGEEGFDFNFVTDGLTHGKYCVVSNRDGTIRIPVEYLVISAENFSTNRTQTVTSSDESILKIETHSPIPEERLNPNRAMVYGYEVYVKAKLTGKTGIAYVSLTIDGKTKSIAVIVLPGIFPVQMQQTELEEAKLSWTADSAVDGYVIRKQAYDDDEEANYLFINDTDICTAKITGKIGKKTEYQVLPYMIYGGKIWCIDSAENNENIIEFTPKKDAVEIKSATLTDGTVTLEWNRCDMANGYEIYGRNRKADTYQLLGTVADADHTSWQDRLSPGTQREYYVVAAYTATKSDPSDTVLMYAPNTTGTFKSKKYDRHIYLSSGDGQYSGSYAEPERIIMYQEKAQLYFANYYGKEMTLYGIDADTLKVKKEKRVRIKSSRKFYLWGGFYHGPDGNNYVVNGDDNSEEKRKKKVIHVTKYDSAWNEVGNCDITADASNTFVGIVQPFRAGSLRMEMIGNILYIVTCRTMFKHSDGLNHQSNIAFRINTDTMEYTDTQEAYVSHSFNQHIRYDHNNLYLLNHGDAFPRAVNVTVCMDYDPTIGNYTSGDWDVNVFSIMGESGNNSTGVKATGLEAFRDGFLTCGNALPHSYKIQGVKGWTSNYEENVYLTVTNLKEETSEVKWISDLNPKKHSAHVGECRMVKLSDSRFALIYSKYEKKRKPKLCYTAVDERGNVLLTKEYKGCSFSGSYQPILFNGYLYIDDASQNKLFRIPAL